MISWSSPQPKQKNTIASQLEDGLLEGACKCGAWNAPVAQSVKQRHAPTNRPEVDVCTKCHLPLRVPEPAVTKGGSEDFLLVNRFSMSSKMSSLEVWQNAALQMLYSPFAKYYYLFMAVVNVGEIVATIMRPNRSTHEEWFILLEVLVVLLLVAEVVVRGLAEQSKFFKNWSNIFDLAVALMCASFLFAVLVMPSIFELMPDWEKVALIRTRDALRLLRLVFLVKNHHKARVLGSTLAPVQLRMDEFGMGYDDSQPLFGQASPGGGPDSAMDFGFSPAPSVDRLESGSGGGVHHSMSPMVGPMPVGKHFATYPQIEREMKVDQV